MYPKRIASIDLGTNSFHLVIVELKDIDSVKSIEEIERIGTFEVLYRQKEVVRINVGNNEETNNLTAEGIERAIKVLKKFKEKIDEFGATTHAIATSAIREASNRDEFLRYVKEHLGIEIKVVSGYEEARLIYLGVLQGLNVYNKQILLIDIGGGSTEVLIGKNGEVLYAASFKLGAVRLTQKFFDGGRTFSKYQKEKCERYIKDVISSNLNPIHDIGYEQSIGTSGEIQSIARLLYLSENGSNKYRTYHDVDFTFEQFQEISNKILKFTTLDEIKSIIGLDEKRAEIIIPGTLILKVLFDLLKIDKITVSSFALREGIIINAIEKSFLRDLDFDLNYNQEEFIIDEKFTSVLELARWYNVDLKHANQVRKIAIKLFAELNVFHKLDEEHLKLLEYAALLHDIGYFISPKKHHKYSYYIIKNSGLLGFDDQEIDIIANIARYHRKALPDEKHHNFKVLSDKDKRTVKILSAILRFSDGLEKTHNALISDIKILPNGERETFTMILRYLTYPPVDELRAAEKRKKVLEDLFDININLRLERISY